MLVALADGQYVSPSPLVILWSVYVLAVAVAAVVTGLKGRWGWLLVGSLTFGLGMFVGAMQPAAPTSVWAKRRRRCPSGDLGPRGGEGHRDGRMRD